MIFIAFEIIETLLSHGCTIKAFDPAAITKAKSLLGDKIEYATNQYDTLCDADALIIATEWSVFRTPDFERIKSELNGNVIFDGRNLYTIEQMKKEGFYYSSIGRPVVT